MFINLDGAGITMPYSRPDRNEITEEKVRKQLKELDALLDVKWIPHVIVNPRSQQMEGRYALICQWPQIDKRWEMYQKGEISENYDILGWFCEDMQDAESVPVDLDSIERKVVELLGKCDNERFPWRGRMKDVVSKNAKVRKERQQEVIDQAEDVARTLAFASGHKEAVQIERMMKEVAEKGGNI